jgi:hypothetical protein
VSFVFSRAGEGFVKRDTAVARNCKIEALGPARPICGVDVSK